MMPVNIQLRENSKSIISRCSGQVEELIHEETLLALDLHIDSLIMIEIIYETEMQFNIVIKDSDMEEVERVDDFYRLVERKFEEKYESI